MQGHFQGGNLGVNVYNAFLKFIETFFRKPPLKWPIIIPLGISYSFNYI